MMDRVEAGARALFEHLFKTRQEMRPDYVWESTAFGMDRVRAGLLTEARVVLDAADRAGAEVAHG